MEQIKLKGFEGIEIFVGTDGRFSATVNGKRLSYSHLGDLEERIMETKQPIAALHVPYPYGFNLPECIEVIRIEADGRLRDKQQYIYDAYSRVYVYDEEAEQKLRALFLRNEELRAEWEAITAELTLLTRDEYIRYRRAEHLQQQASQAAIAASAEEEG